MTATGQILELVVTGRVLHWRGPSPHHFVGVSDEDSDLIQQVAAAVTYGWGMVPVSARVGATTFTTALFPQEGHYLVPLKDAVRAAEDIAVEDEVTIVLTIFDRAAPR